MTPMIFISLLMTRLSAAVFLHGTSNKSIHPQMLEKNSDFGFAMGYLSKTNKLVIGAPSVSLVGKVYICDLDRADTLPEINCPERPYKIPKRSTNPTVKNQKIFMGASIAAYSDHFLTCAPLWTTNVRFKNFKGPEGVGICLFDEKDTRFFGSYEKFHSDSTHPFRAPVYKIGSEQFIGGTGWSTLADEANDLLLIAKSSIIGDLINSKIPRNFTQSVNPSLVSKDKTFTAQDYFNIGFGITSGKFFSPKTVYAINMEEKDMRGVLFPKNTIFEPKTVGNPSYEPEECLKWLMNGKVVKFIEYDSSEKSLHLMHNRTESQKFPIRTIGVGTKFGSVLAATDLDKDGLDELLVAEPLHSEEDSIDCGALHIYKMDASGIRKHLQIIGTDNLGRLGSAIAVNDIDGDGIAEIVVGVPYANGGSGVVYILSGYEVNQILHQKTTLQLSEFKYIQPLRNTAYRTFGFSFQFITDIDGNGCNELVVGAPGSGQAVLFKCLQAIDIKLSNTLVGAQIVREQDLNFTVKVCAEVTYPEKPRDIYAQITLKSNIVGMRASLITPEITVNVSCNNCPKKEVFCDLFTVLFNHVEPGDYKFYSEAKLLTDHIFNSSVLNRSWVVETPYSRLITRRNISRHCVGASEEDCKPNLSMELRWSRRKEEPYILGSTVSETVTIQVVNNGHNAYDACVWINIVGAQLQQLSKHDECRSHDGGYSCDLPKPFSRDEKRDIKLLLNMPNTNEYKYLDITAYLNETCRNELVIKDRKVLNISYVTNTNDVSLHGDTNERQVSEKQKNDEQSAIVDVQEFLIKNDGKITWKNIYTTISTNKTEYTEAFNVTVGEYNCEESHTEEKFIHECYLNIMPTSTLKVIATIYISKSNLEPHLIDKKLTVSSKMEVHLNDTEVKKMSIQSVLKFETELAVGQNKLLIGIIAAVIGLLVLIVIAVALYKSGFFERKEKRKLLVHKESFRQRSSRRNTHIHSAADESGIEDNEDYKEEDDVFHFERASTPPKKTSSDTIQVEAKAQVHC